MDYNIYIFFIFCIVFTIRVGHGYLEVEVVPAKKIELYKDSRIKENSRDREKV